jgi:hypothetical protein
MLALGSAAAALLLARAEEPRYAVADGTELVRAYKGSTKLESEPCKLSVAGKPVPPDETPEIRLKVEDERTIEITDTIEKVEDGRPTKFVRAFGDLSQDGTETVSVVLPDGKDTSKAVERKRTSPFEGKKVRFTWDPEAGEYDEAWVDKGSDDELLEKLEADVDWLGLLPKKPVEKGDTWKLDAKVFVSLQLPSGDLHWKVEGKDPDPVGESISNQLSENLAGDAKATWQGRREVDGQELGVIAIEADLDSHGEGGNKDGEQRTMKLEVEYEGEVLWDLTAGRLAGYAIDGKVRMLMSIESKRPMPQGEALVRQEFDLNGTSRHELEVAAAK